MGEFERRKDQAQEGIQTGAALVGRVAVIITDAVGSIAREIGDFVTDTIEMNEASRAARRDELDGKPDAGDTGKPGEPAAGEPGEPGEGASIDEAAGDERD